MALRPLTRSNQGESQSQSLDARPPKLQESRQFVPTKLKLLTRPSDIEIAQAGKLKQFWQIAAELRLEPDTWNCSAYKAKVHLDVRDRLTKHPTAST